MNLRGEKFPGPMLAQASVSPFNKHVTQGGGRNLDFAFHTKGKL